MTSVNPLCPTCHQPLLPAYYFCPNCDYDLNTKPFVVKLSTQIGLYLLAILLPPLGLWPGIKYLKKNSQQARTVGTVTIVLTLMSLAISSYAIYFYMQVYLNYLNSALGGLGY